MSTFTTPDGTRIFYKDRGPKDAQPIVFHYGWPLSADDWDNYAADVAELARTLNLKDAVHIGHSTGGGEVARYVARSEPGRVAKAALLAAVPPIMRQTEANPEGLPMEVFDGFRSALAANRAQFDS